MTLLLLEWSRNIDNDELVRVAMLVKVIEKARNNEDGRNPVHRWCTVTMTKRR